MSEVKGMIIEMQQISIKKIAFSSFIKLFVLTGLSSGVILGLFLFISIVFFGSGSAKIGTTTYYGLQGGIISLFITPFICMIIGFFGGIFGYFSFRILVKVLKKVSICGEFEDVDKRDIDA